MSYKQVDDATNFICVSSTLRSTPDPEVLRFNFDKRRGDCFATGSDSFAVTGNVVLTAHTALHRTQIFPFAD